MSKSTNRIDDAVQVIIKHMHIPEATAPRRDQIARGLRTWEKRTGDDVLRFVLPSFPYKSQNTWKKTLGHLPDAGEESTLDNLHGMMVALSKALQRKCQILIYADGFVFYDIANVKEQDGKAYCNGVRTMIEMRRYSETLVVMEWAPDVVSWSEKQAILMREHGSNFHDTADEILQSTSISRKYAGLKRFIADDLNVADNPPSTALRRISGEKAMIQLHRAKAIIRSIEALCPTGWRLSIHRNQPDLSLKLPIRLGCDAEGIWRTPWQNAPVKLSEGGMVLVNRMVAEKGECPLVRLEDGQPWCYQATRRFEKGMPPP